MCNKVLTVHRHCLMLHVLSAYSLDVISWRKLIPMLYKIGRRDLVDEDYRCNEDSDMHHACDVSMDGIFHTSAQNDTVNQFILVIKSGHAKKMKKRRCYYRCDKCRN